MDATDKIIRALLILLGVLVLVIGVTCGLIWMSGQFAILAPSRMSSPTPTVSPSRTPIPPTPTPTALPTPTPLPSPTPTRMRTPTPTPVPTPVPPPEAVPPQGWLPIPANLYFIREGSLWRWSREGGLEQIVAGPATSGTSGGKRASPASGGLPVPLGVIDYRITPDERFLVYTFVRQDLGRYRSEIIFLDLGTRRSLVIPGTTTLTYSQPITPLIDITPNGHYVVYLAWNTRPTTLSSWETSDSGDGRYGTIFAVDTRNPNHEYELGYCAARERECGGFALSPDGSGIVFLDGRGIWFSEVPGGKPRLLVEQPHYNCIWLGRFAWAPHSKSVLTEWVCIEVGESVIIDIRAKAIKGVPQTGRHLGFATASWSSSGQELLVGRTDFERGDLMRVSADNPKDEEILLSGTSIWPTSPRELPDGRIAFANQACAAKEDTPWGIYVMEKDGQNLRRTVSLPAPPCHGFIPYWAEILWSPDGSAFLYLFQKQPLLLGLTDGSALWDVHEVLAGAHDFQWRPPYTGYSPSR